MNKNGETVSAAAPRSAELPASLQFRDGDESDLELVNTILTGAIAGWGLPQRVIRLALPTLHYKATDLATMTVRIASDGSGQPGFSALEPADPGDTPAGLRGLLLHGLYVLPERQGRGIGASLVADATLAARTAGLDGLSIRAWRESAAFFRNLGFERFGVDTATTYPLRFWRGCVNADRQSSCPVMTCSEAP